MTDQVVDTGGVQVSARTSDANQFLGRTRELKELRADIERAGLDTLSGRKAPRARVLLIAGRPGSGRTALAEELVRQVADRYPDGVLRARLTDPDGTPVPVRRTARLLLTALDRPTPPGAPRTTSPQPCARPSPTAGSCCCSTTPPRPTRSTPCCRTPRNAWPWPSPAGR